MRCGASNRNRIQSLASGDLFLRSLLQCEVCILHHSSVQPSATSTKKYHANTVNLILSRMFHAQWYCMCFHYPQHKMSLSFSL
jgi:hypothetical protein